MNYKSKYTKKILNEIVSQKIFGKSGEMIKRPYNTAVQLLGQGKIARSSSLTIGKISNINNKIEKKADPEEIIKRNRKKNLKLSFKQGKISKDEYERQKEKLEENIIFFKDNKKNIKVKQNNEIFSLKDFLKNAKKYSNIISDLKNKIKNENFSGTIIQYIINKTENGTLTIKGKENAN